VLHAQALYDNPEGNISLEPLKSSHSTVLAPHPVVLPEEELEELLELEELDELEELLELELDELLLALELEELLLELEELLELPSPAEGSAPQALSINTLIATDKPRQEKAPPNEFIILINLFFIEVLNAYPQAYPNHTREAQLGIMTISKIGCRLINQKPIVM